MLERQQLRLVVNGEDRVAEVSGEISLLDFLRDEMGLFSVKPGCRVGYCGSCTVLVDDLAVHSCCLLAIQVEGCRLETVEGGSPEVAACQAAIAANNAVQCGVCIPGIIMSGAGLLRSNASGEEAKDMMLGNICRCGGYSRIVRAIQEAGAGGRRDRP